MTKDVKVRAGAALVSAALVALSTVLPLWTLTMRAPQYPQGLHLYTYGTGMSGDLRELNILNHYIGMPPVETPALETAIYPWGIAGLIVLCLLSPYHRVLRRLAILAIAATPLAILLDLQWRLYVFGHSLDPHAPIRLEPFTPYVIGTTKLGVMAPGLATAAVCGTRRRPGSCAIASPTPVTACTCRLQKASSLPAGGQPAEDRSDAKQRIDVVRLWHVVRPFLFCRTYDGPFVCTFSGHFASGMVGTIVVR